MKRRTARVLRAVVRLIEEDVRDWGEAVVEIDERVAVLNKVGGEYSTGVHLYGIATRDMMLTANEDLDRRLSDVEAILADNANHSRKAREVCGSMSTMDGRCYLLDGHDGMHRATNGIEWAV